MKIIKNANFQIEKSDCFKYKLLTYIDDGIVVIEEDKKEKFWDKWWNSFETADLQRVQGTQEREDIF